MPLHAMSAKEKLSTRYVNGVAVVLWTPRKAPQGQKLAYEHEVGAEFNAGCEIAMCSNLRAVDWTHCKANN